MATTTKRATTLDVFLFVPNLVGYSRVLLAFASLFYMKWHPKVCTVLYGLSCLLDALDGTLARKLNQTSQFGGILDMVTDRCTTSCLICYLCITYPSYVMLFQVLVSLDLASHYAHMYSMLSQGATSHKKVGSQSKLLKLYYTNNKVLFVIVAANELFFMSLYLLSFPMRTPPVLGYYRGIPLGYPTIICITSFPLWVLKQVLNVIQLQHACLSLASSDAEDRNKLVKND